MPEIREEFDTYQPPGWLVSSAQKLLSVVPPDQLSAVDTIILTEADNVRRGRIRRVRGRKYARSDCLGFYHPAGRHNTAWIEIVVDNIFASVPRFVRWIPPLRELALGEILYHEIGHHFQRTYGSALGERAAENWSRRLTQKYMREHYRWLLPMGWLIVRTYDAVSRRLTSRFSGRATRAAERDR